MEAVRLVDLNRQQETDFIRRFSGCLILTHDGKILLQQRDDNPAVRFSNFLATFGGAHEAGETPLEALIRELQEELGAHVEAQDVVSLGAVTEDVTHHEDLVYLYFWHDTKATITGCYEGKPRHYDTAEAVFSHPKIMDDVYWMLQECQKRGLLK